uniref:Uncharacterized protein n=1 Tax=Anguilla anguilla TaxID=7936 RepID=A0A0E9PIJ8_ANGAN
MYLKQSVVVFLGLPKLKNIYNSFFWFVPVPLWT